MTELICNRKSRKYPKCQICPHGRDHKPIAECNTTDTACSQDLDKDAVVLTKCQVKNS